MTTRDAAAARAGAVDPHLFVPTLSPQPPQSYDMSIVELLKTVDHLVRAVAQKNQELDTLKRHYDAKLKHMDDLLSQVERLVLDPHASANDEAESLKCSHCNNTINTEGYVIMKKESVLQMLQQIDPSRSRETLRLAESQPTDAEPHPMPPPVHSSKPTRKSCSYCHEVGHTRAKCIKRLTTPAKE